jgi:anti-sigma B factor antagonist
MAINTRTVGDVTVLDMSGKLTIGVGDAQLRDAVQQALENGSTKLVLNMSALTTIDSAGIGELVSAYTRVNNRGGKLKLENLPPKVTDILMITQLITVFEVYDNEEEAVASFE